MLNWFKNAFGITPKRDEETLVLTQEQRVEETTKPKKVETDLDSMDKKELLAEAKKRGIKANASLKKEIILERIKSA